MSEEKPNSEQNGENRYNGKKDGRFIPGNPGKPKGCLNGSKRIVTDAFLHHITEKSLDPKWIASMLKTKYGKEIVLRAVANSLFGRDAEILVKNYNVNRVETNGNNASGSTRRVLIDRLHEALSEGNRQESSLPDQPGAES